MSCISTDEQLLSGSMFGKVIINFTQQTVFRWTEGSSNNYSEFSGEQMMVQNIAVTSWGDRIIAQKFITNYRSLQIIVWKFAWIKTIRITKMQGNFIKNIILSEISMKSPEKSGISLKFVSITFSQYCTLPHDTYKTSNDSA